MKTCFNNIIKSDALLSQLASRYKYMNIRFLLGPLTTNGTKAIQKYVCQPVKKIGCYFSCFSHAEGQKQIQFPSVKCNNLEGRGRNLNNNKILSKSIEVSSIPLTLSNKNTTTKTHKYQLQQINSGV